MSRTPTLDNPPDTPPDAPPGDGAQWEFITPERAKDLLAQNTNNYRALDHKWVFQLREIIRRDEWSPNNDAVALATNGSVINGQHRLNAVVDANRGVWLLMLYDMPPDSQLGMDWGKRRSVADALASRGFTNATVLAGGLARIWRYRQTSSLRDMTTKLSPTLALQMIEEIPELVRSVPVSRALRQLGFRYSPSLATALHYLFAEIDRRDADTFFDQLGSGVNLEEGDPILLLHRQLVKDATNIRKLPEWHIAALTIKAWNAWFNGDRPGLLRFRPGGSSPERFPIIVDHPQHVDLADDGGLDEEVDNELG